MGAVAGLLQAAGHEVRGSDEAVYPPMSDFLADMHIPVSCPFDAANLDWGPDEVVVGNICRRDHVEVLAARERNIPLTSFPAVLGERILPDRHPVVVAGTHGKTTTSSILATLLWRCGRDPGWFIGGIPNDLSSGCVPGSGKYFVLEGDEYDTAFFDKGSKFFHYQPHGVILTGVEFDHADIFSDLAAVENAFEKFIDMIPEDGHLLACADNPFGCRQAARKKGETYGLAGENTDFAASVIRMSQEGTSFTLDHRGEDLGEFFFPMPGIHNLRNAVGSLAMCIRLGLSPEELKTPLAMFGGVRRRQELLAEGRGMVVVDDFGHHPTAIRVTLEACRQKWPGRRMVAVFEPRSATSRRAVFQKEYADVLSRADAVFLAPAYDSSRIPENERLDTARLGQAIADAGRSVFSASGYGDLLQLLRENTQKGDLVVFFSSGAMGGIKGKFAQWVETGS